MTARVRSVVHFRDGESREHLSVGMREACLDFARTCMIREIGWDNPGTLTLATSAGTWTWERKPSSGFTAAERTAAVPWVARAKEAKTTEALVAFWNELSGMVETEPASVAFAVNELVRWAATHFDRNGAELPAATRHTAMLVLAGINPFLSWRKASATRGDFRL